MVTVPKFDEVSMQLFGEYRNDLPDPLSIDPDFNDPEYYTYFGVVYPQARFIANSGCVVPTILARIDTTTANYIGYAYCLTSSPVTFDVTPQTISGAIFGPVINMPPGQIAGDPPIGLYPLITDLLDDDFLGGIGAYQVISFGPDQAENFVVSASGGVSSEAQGATTGFPPFYSYSDVYDNQGTCFFNGVNSVMFDDNSGDGVFRWNLNGDYEYSLENRPQKYTMIYDFGGETYFFGGVEGEDTLAYTTFSDPATIVPVELEGFPAINNLRRYHTTPNIDFYYTVDPDNFDGEFMNFYLVKKDFSSYRQVIVNAAEGVPFIGADFSIMWSDDAQRFLVLGGDW